MPPKRKPAPSLRLSQEPEERPTVEFRIRRMVDQENDDGDIVRTAQTSVELFQVKLHSELALGDFEEMSRLNVKFQELMEQQGQMDDSEWLLQLKANYRLLMDLAFYDPVPVEAVHGLTLERLDQIADFLSELWLVTMRQRT